MRPQFEMIARTHYGIEIQSGPFGIVSRPSLIGAKFAEQQGQGEAYHQAVFRAYWQEARSIADEQELEAIAHSSGLNAADFMASLNQPDYEAEVDADIAFANEIGISGVPAMLFLGKYLLSGAQPYDELARIVDQIRARHAII